MFDNNTSIKVTITVEKNITKFFEANIFAVVNGITTPNVMIELDKLINKSEIAFL